MKPTKIGLVVAAIAVAALALPGSASASAHAKPVAAKQALFVPDFTAVHLHTMCKMTIGLE